MRPRPRAPYAPQDPSEVLEDGEDRAGDPRGVAGADEPGSGPARAGGDAVTDSDRE